MLWGEVKTNHVDTMSVLYSNIFKAFAENRSLDGRYSNKLGIGAFVKARLANLRN
jgi:hypothetical protein